MKNPLPDYQEKQKILYIDRRSTEGLIGYGDRSLEANLIFDALEFYQKAKHRPGLEKIGQRAFGLKKFTFARHAFEQVGDSAMLEEIRNIPAEETRKVE